MKKGMGGILAAWFMMGALCLYGGTYGYKGMYSVDFPASWEVETEEEIIMAHPDDGSIFISLWVAEDFESFEAIVDGLAKLTEDLFEVDDERLSDIKEMEINGIPFAFMEGKGKDEDGAAVNFTLAIFCPDGSNLVSMIYYGTPEAEQVHKQAVQEIIKSIRPAPASRKDTTDDPEADG